MLCYLFFTILLGAFGVICLLFAMKNKDFLLRYDDTCGGNQTCSISFTLPKTLINPKIYYKLDNFYANHRNFVKSRNYAQLRGNTYAVDKIGTCDPIKTISDVGFVSFAFDGVTKLNGTEVANPCGLIAKYFFTDSYALF